MDENNRIVLNSENFPVVIDRLESLKIFDDVKSRLNSIEFRMPQVTESTSNYFGNESVYGNFVFLVVYGFMKME